MKSKIYSDILSFTENKRESLVGKKLVFTNGCFDILHPGHLHYLEAAKRKGDILIVGLNSDDSVKKLKGKNRPINDIDYRSHMLAGLEAIDYVIVFEEDTPLDLIEKVNPDVLVKGADYSLDQVVGAKFVQSQGGVVILVPFLEGYSTSKWLNTIIKNAE